MLVDKEREVPDELVKELCELAMWAPNHKRTWPWRFAHLSGEARARYGDTIADALAIAGKDEATVAKTRTKFLRTPSILVVGSDSGDSEIRTAENRDAVAAGVQNILLAGTARGLATYWGSCPEEAQEVVAAFCGFDSDTRIVGNIYLGWASSWPDAPARPPVQINRIS